MFSSISWGQFLVFVVPSLFLYGAVVAYLFYRDRITKSATSSNLVGRPVNGSSPSATTANVMGKTLEQKNGRDQPGRSVACEACGHVHGSPVTSPRLNSYGIPISPRTAEVAPSAPLTEDFDPVDGGVDVQSMLANLEKVKSVSVAAFSGASTDDVISEKAEVLSLFANDDLLNSEFATQFATKLDESVPTMGYSAVATLETLKAA